MNDIADIVIVGGGSAGCALAERLSADPARTVIMLEAGRGDQHPLHAFPVLTGHFYRQKQDNWYYHTQPQPELNGREVFWPRGKRLGGSSIFNGMVYARGNPDDYNRWAQFGNHGWSYEDVLPYFKRNERHQHGETDLHGGAGMVHVTPARPRNPLFKAYLEAGRQAGYAQVSDINSPDRAGVCYYDFHMSGGRRSNSAGALLRVARSRPNLAIIDRASATRIVLKGGRAVEVEYRRAGETRRVGARREIVLSSGAIGTPQILLLSGIGDPEHLREVGVTPVHDLPGVGMNLVDHLDASIRVLSQGPVSLIRELRVDRLARNLTRALMFGTGPVSESPISAGGFFFSRPGLRYPDLQAFFIPTQITGISVWLPYTARARRMEAEHGYSLRMGPVRPQSRGRLTLASPDPDVAPRLDPRYLSDGSDLAATVEGLKIARKILAQPAFEPFRKGEIAPGPDVMSDAELAEFVRETANTVFHPVGTARMGSDRLAVVDERLRVHGIAGLRVADASIMPTITSGNTNAPTLMIAEKAADMIAMDDRA